VVGVGEVGSRVVRRAEALGMAVLKNDPPLREMTGDPDYQPLDEVLRASHIVTLHVPLTRHGPFPTEHLANFRFFEAMRPGALFLNASRGEVADTKALLYALKHGVVSSAALDVWENEPRCPPALMREVDIATPHIAGYSIEGLLNGTRMLYDEAVGFFETTPTWTPSPLPQGRGASHVDLDARGFIDEEALALIVREVYDIEVDDCQMRSSLTKSDDERAEHFVRSRREYPVRREFSATSVKLYHASPTLERKVAGLGFQLESD
jgi:erythronate-4-phosphate dehydrogenase